MKLSRKTAIAIKGLVNPPRHIGAKSIAKTGIGGGTSGTPDPNTYYKLAATYTAGTSSNPASVAYCNAAGTATGSTGTETIPTLDAGTVITTLDVVVKGETPTKLLSDIQWSSPYLQKKSRYRFRNFATAETAWTTFTTASVIATE